MPNLTPEKELEILEALRSKVASVPGAINVITNEPMLDSKHDVLDSVCFQNADDETEVRYLKIDLLGFSDLPEEGCEDNPVVNLNYNLHLFHQLKEVRTDGSSSLKDIKKLVIDLRNAFLPFKNNARRLAENCTHLPLVQGKFIILGSDDVTGYYGHFTDLICKVEIL